MRRAWTAGLLAISLLIVLRASPAHAGGEDKLARLLIKKGIITAQEYAVLKREVEEAAADPQPTPQDVAEALRDEVRQELRRPDEAAIGVTLRVEGEGRWRAHRDAGVSCPTARPRPLRAHGQSRPRASRR